MAKTTKKLYNETEQETQAVQVEETKTETKQDTAKVQLRALQNTQMPNGDFVALGQIVWANPDFAEAVLAEQNSHFEKV
jgi:hypothetical protein